MKIGIFGDSYVNSNLKPYYDFCGLSWVESLGKVHDVVNFGQPGVSFAWCYELFLKHKKDFDLCIVVVTTPYRIYIKALEDDPAKPTGHFFASPEFRQEYRQRTTDQKTLKILDSIDVWYDNWRDHVFEDHLHNLMVRDVMSHDNVLLIPGFSSSIENYNGQYQNLTDIQFWELLQLDPNFDHSRMSCKRKCHLSEENNQVLFELVINAISDKKKVLDLNINDFVKPNKNIDFYAEVYNLTADSK